MKINKVIVILTLSIMVELIVSCCDCVEPLFYNYTNCSLTINSLDNSGSAPVVTQSNTILKSAYGIRIAVNRKEDICKTKTTRSFLFRSAYATSCDCPPEYQYLALDSITSLNIYTINAFNEEHSSNSDITEYFYVYSGTSFITISDYIKNLEITLYDFINPVLEFDLLLMEPPSSGSEHQFQISLKLSDGRELIKKTNILELNE